MGRRGSGVEGKWERKMDVSMGVVMRADPTSEQQCNHAPPPPISEACQHVKCTHAP